MGARPRILIAYTGGTIGMRAGDRGYRPEPGHLEEVMARTSRLHRPEVPRYDIREFSPLLDSADMTPADWLRIARVIDEHHDDYDGFLVIHGTDTMAYTASALSYMLEGLGKPVILTGSQIPLFEARNDAVENLLTSLVILGRFHERLSEVFVYFDAKLFRGNRCTKVDTDSFSAFASPCLSPVAEVGVGVTVNWNLVRPRHLLKQTVVDIGAATVGAFRVFPGMKASYLANLLAAPVQGIVLECYGGGNVPSLNRPFLDSLEQASARGVIIVAVTQPPRGTANLDLYATGRVLLDAGVVSGYDMTPEAALTKLYYLFETGHEPDQVRRLVQDDLRGELSPPAPEGADATPPPPRGTQRYRGL